MRKFLALLSAVAIATAACGSTTTPSTAPSAGGGAASPSAGGGATLPEGTLRVLVHQNPPFTDFMGTFNAAFEANHPGVKVDMSIVAPADLATSTQTRLAAGDVDVVDIFAFDTGVQPYMKDAAPPIWQTLADAGSLMDLTDQPFVKLYDENATRDAGTYNGKVYAINLGAGRIQWPVHQQGSVHREQCRGADDMERAGEPHARRSRPRTSPASPPVARTAGRSS